MPTEGVQLSICLVLTRHRRLVGAAGTRLPPSYGAPARLSNDGTEDAGDPGIATSVSPRPNRLVLLGANRPHRIARVNENAGSQRPHQYRRFFLALTVTMEEAATWSTVDQPHRSFELNGISRMGEPLSNVSRADLVPGTTCDADKVGRSSWGVLPNVLLLKRPADGVEVMRVGREVDEPDSEARAPVLHAGVLVRAEVVEQQDVSAAQTGQELGNEPRHEPVLIRRFEFNSSASTAN